MMASRYQMLSKNENHEDSADTSKKIEREGFANASCKFQPINHFSFD